MLRTLALIALAPALASAKTSVVARDAHAGEPSTPDEQDATQFAIGSVGVDVVIDKLRVAVTRGDVTTVRLSFTLSTRADERRQTVIPLALPTGSRITGAAVRIGTGERVVATTLAPDRARETYQGMFQVGKDPILVEQVNDELDAHAIANDAFEPDARMWNAFTPVPAHATERAGFTNYVVRAFPLTKKERARVELTIELADYDASRLVIAHAQRIGTLEIETPTAKAPPSLDAKDCCEATIRTRRDVGAPISVPLPAVERMPVAAATIAPRTSVVDPAHSLFAGWASETGTMPTVMISHPVHDDIHRSSSVDGRDIRRKVKQHILQLARCYTKVTEYRGGPEGTAVMHFLIDTNGSVSSVTIDGEIDDERITTCLEEEVRGWEFRSGDARVMVNYPLQFRLAR